MEVTAYTLAQRFVGLKETPGTVSNAMVLGFLQLDQSWPTNDEIPWCSAFVNFIAWILRLPRSKDLRARSWLNVGTPIHIADAKPGFDVVVLSRGDDPESGHVGFFAGWDHGNVILLGGNQGNAVKLASFDVNRVIGVRRLLG